MIVLNMKQSFCFDLGWFNLSNINYKNIISNKLNIMLSGKTLLLFNFIKNNDVKY